MELADFRYIIAGAAGWTVAQALKYALSLRQDGFSLDDFFASGGMPSSHSGFVASIATVVGLQEGFESAVFGVALTLLGVVVYDAVGVRRATGENTKILSDILAKLKIRETSLALNMAMGHTPYQVVAGVFTGVVVGLATNLLIG
ncbi:MAG: divergent PAP2 family protein [Patescibacteria group bacterium]